MNLKDFQYRVVEAGGSKDLAEQVRTYLADGWIAQGGLMIVNLGDGDFLYAQAITWARPSHDPLLKPKERK